MITIQVSATNQIGARIIKLGTWSWANHVDFVLPDGTLLGALAVDPSGKVSRDYLRKGGVQIHPMPPLAHYSRVERYVVDAPDSVLDFAKSQVGKPYDWKGIAAFLSHNRDWQDDDAWFCSELVAYSFAQAGVQLLRDVAYRITPRDILLSPLLKFVSIPPEAIK